MGVMRGPLSWFDSMPVSETLVRSPSSEYWLTLEASQAFAAPIELRSLEDDELLASVDTLDQALTAAKKLGKPVRLWKRGRVLGETL